MSGGPSSSQLSGHQEYDLHKNNVSPKTQVVFCWHMHQPDYRDSETGEYHFPWTYLHAIKDYVDMVAHIEAHPKAKAVVNFAPILLEQIDDYAKQLKACLNTGERIKDELLNLLISDEIPPVGSDNFKQLADKCLRSNEERLINRFPAYQYLVKTFNQLPENPQAQTYINDQFLIDLCVWYQLAWMGETVRRTDARIQRLQKKAFNFDIIDRRELMRIICELVSGVIPRYKRLYEDGQIELIMSPYAHPIVPLLIDLQSTKEAMPDAPMPKHEIYPGGFERADWHIKKGIKVFKQFFDATPKGAWPSEGAVSSATLKLFEDNGFDWVATGDSVLHNSLSHHDNAEIKQVVDHHQQSIHRAYSFQGSNIKCFFRDDNLSDVIGFQYSTWHGDHAVDDLIHKIEQAAEHVKHTDNNVVSIIMDGENAWEFFPENAFYFLDGLYKKLAEHPHLEMTTYQNILAKKKIEPVKMQTMVGGSWVYGSYSTWIGDKDKNHGWDLLCEAKIAVDKALLEKDFKPAQHKKIIDILAICEGSDWFWWFGDYNPSQSVKDFELLYRKHLRSLYEAINEPVPEGLHQVLSVGSGDPAAGGVMRQGHEV